MRYLNNIDLHLHSSVSDGTDAPCEIIDRMKEAGIGLFSLTDHDTIKGCEIIQKLLAKDDPAFIAGVEFSCREKEERFHILGYGYDVQAPDIINIVNEGHALRMKKLENRLAFLEKEFGFTFSDEDVSALYSLDNPGKPHIGNLMVKYGYAADRKEAIQKYLILSDPESEYFLPEQAIRAILGAGGIPVLAHPSYGRGDELIIGEEMDRRLRRLIDFGLQGVEAFYSGFTPGLQNEMLAFAERYGLYVTAGSDYHGKNKTVKPGETNLGSAAEFPEGLKRFLDDVSVQRI